MLIGDAPPHPEDNGIERLHLMVHQWTSRGFIHVIDTTGYGVMVPELKEIARRGGGVSISLPSDALLAQNLAVCILGPKWSESVIELFRNSSNEELPAQLPE